MGMALEKREGEELVAEGGEGGRGWVRWSKTCRQGEGQKVVLHSRVGS